MHWYSSDPESLRQHIVIRYESLFAQLTGNIQYSRTTTNVHEFVFLYFAHGYQNWEVFHKESEQNPGLFKKKKKKSGSI